MKERRGTVGRLTGLAEGVAASARRRQRERAPRVLLYDRSGHPEVLAPGAAGFEEVVSAAELMIESLSGPGERPEREDGKPQAPPSPRGVSVPGAIREPERETDVRGGPRDEG